MRRTSALQWRRRQPAGRGHGLGRADVAQREDGRWVAYEDLRDASPREPSAVGRAHVAAGGAGGSRV